MLLLSQLTAGRLSVHRIRGSDSTLHYRRLPSRIMFARMFSVRHTSENLKNELLRVVNDWEIADKIVAVVTDNAANIQAAVKQAGFKHVSCFAHTLNLVVQSAIQSIDTLKTKVKHIVEYFHRSTVAAEKLASLQLQMREDKGALKLKNDVVTRRNSTYHMCSRLCDVQEPLEAAIAVLHNPVTPLSADEWVALKEVTSSLKPFDAVTTEVSAEKSVTVSKVIMLSRGLMSACRKTEAQLTNELAKVMMAKLIEGLRARFGLVETNPLFARATFLDPRFKKKGFASDNIYSQVLSDVTGIVARKMSSDTAETSEHQRSAAAAATTATAGEPLEFRLHCVILV